MGVCSGTYPLNGTSVGSTDQAFGVTATGGIDYDATFQGLFDATATTHYGMVVDYRGPHPIVHAIIRDFDWDLLEIRPKIGRSLTMTNVTTPVYILAAGLRTVVGEEIEINAGNDTTNFPFHYDVRAVLRAAGLDDVASALVLGWGRYLRRTGELASERDRLCRRRRLQRLHGHRERHRDRPRGRFADRSDRMGAPVFPALSRPDPRVGGGASRSPRPGSGSTRPARVWSIPPAT